MAKITLNEIIDAFILQNKSVLKMKEINEYVLNKRGNSWAGYKSLKSVFINVSRAFYSLEDYKFWADSDRYNTPDSIIIKLITGTNDQDSEVTTRSLRELNILNRNIQLVLGLKKLYGNECQLCGNKLLITKDNFYSEVHHIKSLGAPHNGPDTSTNMIVVCPNCHVLLDFNAVPISKEKIKFYEPHKLDDKHIDYHNKIYEYKKETCRG